MNGTVQRGRVAREFVPGRINESGPRRPQNDEHWLTGSQVHYGVSMTTIPDVLARKTSHRRRPVPERWARTGGVFGWRSRTGTVMEPGARPLHGTTNRRR